MAPRLSFPHCRIEVRTNTQHRVVLLPEYPDQDQKSNPALKSHKAGLPDFKNITESSCYYALGQRLMEFESAVCRMEEKIEAGETEWENVLLGLEREKLECEYLFSLVSLLEIVTDKLDMDRFKQLTRRAERALLTKYDSRTVHDFITGDWVKTVQAEDKTLLDRFVTEYKHQGYELTEKKYMELNSNWLKRLSEAQRDHRFKVTTSTQRFRHVIRDPAVVREFPVDLLRAMSADSSQPARGPWSVSLHPYIYRKFLSYCPDRRLRWNTYNASVSRGSMTADHYLNCAGHVKDIRQHRLDQAIVLGYHNYAEMSMVTKMANNVENVNTMISSLLGPARSHQEQEIASLQEYAESRGFTDKIREFDVEFFRRKQVRTLYGVEEEALRDYFPFPVVLENVFKLLLDQFGLEISEVSPDGDRLGSVWHQDVTLYRVSQEGQELGHFYMDPYIRDDKAYQGGDRGYFIPLASHSQKGESQALGAVVMALNSPGFGKPSLLSMAEVEEVVRQFGKLLHHFMARGKWSEVSGRTVEWDCLHLVPELMVLWLNVPHVLQSMSQHWSSGEKLSAGQVSSLLSARTHLAGYDLCQELYKAAYDMAFYSEDYEAEQYTDLAARLADQFLVLPREKEDSFPLYFEEMLTGHWAAGYFSQIWARMLAADIFSAYTEVGFDNTEAIRKISTRLTNTFLKAGSSTATADLFRQFRGRDPTPEALLISLGLKHTPQPKNRGPKS